MPTEKHKIYWEYSENNLSILSSCVGHTEPSYLEQLLCPTQVIKHYNELPSLYPICVLNDKTRLSYNLVKLKEYFYLDVNSILEG